MSSKKYFFFDIDGTLVSHLAGDSHLYCPESTRRTLKLLKENGHFVSVATGRARWMTEDVAGMLDIDCMVTDGGNGVIINNKVVEIIPLDREKALAICQELHKAGHGVGVQMDDSRNIYCKNAKMAENNPQYDGFINYVIDERFDFKSVDNFYKLFIDVKEDEAGKYESLTLLPYMRYHPNNIMVEPADKFVGIERVIKYIEGDINEVVVFGDGHNDIEMFKKAPISIAMGNAVEELKLLADFITKDVDNDGIEYACRHFGWI